MPLKPGERKPVRISLSTDQFGYYDEGHWNIAPGQYVVKVGASSQDIRLVKTVEIKDDKVEKPLRDTYFSVNG